MRSESLVSPKATARFIVTLPPEPSRLAEALKKDIASDLTALHGTTDAFRHLAIRAKDRLVIMIPFVDRTGAEWATELVTLTDAPERVLVLRDTAQLSACGVSGSRLRDACTQVKDYSGKDHEGLEETFHAKIVLADGTAAYVGSANLLYRSKSVNLECGMLVEGPAVHAIKVVVDAVLATFE